MILEAFGAFFPVTAGVYALTQSLYTALIFGALSSATAPAATVDVLAEYDAKGPLTTTLLAVVGLDDALSLLLYSLTAAFAASLMAGGETPTLIEILVRNWWFDHFRRNYGLFPQLADASHEKSS